MPSRKTDTPPAEPARQVQLAENRKAHFDYQIESRLEAGIALRGTEIKSLRAGHANLRDGYARVENGEVWLHSVHISPYKFADGFAGPEPDRPRKLLLHRREIDRLQSRVAQERLTLVPLSIYFKDGRAKVELALARGRRKGDQRQAIAKRDADREAERAMARRQRGAGSGGDEP